MNRKALIEKYERHAHIAITSLYQAKCAEAIGSFVRTTGESVIVLALIKAGLVRRVCAKRKRKLQKKRREVDYCPCLDCWFWVPPR